MDVKYKSLDFLGYPGYEIGNDGTVWGMSRGKRRQLKFHLTGEYHSVVLSNKGVQKNRMVGRLVLLTFKKSSGEGRYCHYKDGNKKNNHIDNLEWKDKACKTYLKDKQVVTIRNSKKLSQKELAQKYGVTPSCISNIQRGKVYKSVGGTIRISRSKSRLTEDQFKQIKELYEKGKYTQQKIAEMFGVKQGSVSYIVRKR